MARWLMKTEPEDYGWDRLVEDGETDWTGVRNHQAAKNLRTMALGEEVFFYRSVVEPAVLGIMTVSATAFPDHEDPRWAVVKVKPLRKLTKPVPLAAIKADGSMNELALIRQSRLSVMPVSDAHWQKILELAGEG